MHGGQLVETRRPAELIHDRRIAGDEFEIRYPRSQPTQLTIVMLALLAVIYLLFDVLIPHRDQRGREFLPILYGMFVIMTVLAYALRHIVIIRIDCHGVTATPLATYSIRPTTIPWSDIGWCDFITATNPFGGLSVEYPLIKDPDGRNLFMSLPSAMAFLNAGDRQNVLRALKARFPNLEQCRSEPEPRCRQPRRARTSAIFN